MDRHLRVFVSHTNELARYPRPRDFVTVAMDALQKVSQLPIDVTYSAERERLRYKPHMPTAEYCIARVRECNIYVALIGFHYGSLVVDRPDMSYTELELEAATEAGMPCLLFVLDDHAEVPFIDFGDLEYGHRQQQFRRHLGDRRDLHVVNFRDADDLYAAVARTFAEPPERFAAAITSLYHRACPECEVAPGQTHLAFCMLSLHPLLDTWRGGTREEQRALDAVPKGLPLLPIPCPLCDASPDQYHRAGWPPLLGKWRGGTLTELWFIAAAHKADDSPLTIPCPQCKVARGDRHRDSCPLDGF